MISFPKNKFNNLASYDEKTKTIQGKLARVSNHLLGHQICKIISTDSVGKEYWNGTHYIRTGGVEKLFRKEGDLFMHMNNYYQNYPSVEFTHPVSNEKYVAIHTINHLHEIKDSVTIIDMISIDPLYCTIYSSLTIVFVIYLIFQFRQYFGLFRALIPKLRFNKYCEVIGYVLRKRSKNVSKAKILRICFLLWSFVLLDNFSKYLVLNSFKISKVFVDTGDIINSHEQMLTTQKEICFFQNEGIMDLFKSSPKSSFFKLVYDKKYEGCRLNYSKLNRLGIIKFEFRGFLVTSYVFASIMAYSLVGRTGSNYWISQDQFTLNLAHMIRKSLDRKKKVFLRSYLLRYLEFGINQHCMEIGILNARFFTPISQEKIFESIKDIIDQHTKFIANDLKSYYSILIAYFAFNLAVLIVFIVHNLCIKLRIRSRIRVYLKLRKLKMEIKKRNKEIKKRLKEKEKKISLSL